MKQVVVSQFIQWVASAIIQTILTAAPASLSSLFDFRYIEDLEHPEGAVSFKALIGAPSIGLVVVIDMH
jgi:hypothetical protein